MKKSTPLGAEPIFVEWMTADGGVRAVAWTDIKGSPYIGIFTLNRMGKPNGLPCWLRRRCFLSPIVIGFDRECPVIVILKVNISAMGLTMVIRLPWLPASFYTSKRRLFAPWGSEAPSLGFIVMPSNDGGKASFFLSEAS